MMTAPTISAMSAKISNAMLKKLSCFWIASWFSLVIFAPVITSKPFWPWSFSDWVRFCCSCVCDTPGSALTEICENSFGALARRCASDNVNRDAEAPARLSALPNRTRPTRW